MNNRPDPVPADLSENSRPAVSSAAADLLSPQEKAGIVRSNRLGFAALLLGLLLSCVVMALPLYTFKASVYTKKSSNTFVGDEKYIAARAEVEQIAQEYADQGMKAEISEKITERTNSKGETTSLIAFSIEETFRKSIWSFLACSLPSSRALLLMLCCMAASLLSALAGCLGSMEQPHKHLKRSSRILRTLSCVFSLGCFLFTPVFIFMNNYAFWRKLGLYGKDLITDGKDAYYKAMDQYLFGGAMGDKIEQALSNLSMDPSPLLGLLLVCFLLAGIGSILIRCGTLRHALMRAVMYLFIIAVCVVTLYPYYVMFITAFRSNAEALDMYFLHMLPTSWIWSNLTDIISRGVPRYLLNSVMIAGGATLLAMLCGIPAAFAMARMNFKGKKFFLGFVIMSQMFSPVVLLIGISQLMNMLHLNDTILGLICINAAFNQAFAIWLLRGTFVAISPEMEQAARIDGCTTIGSLIHVLLPMAAPGIVTTLIFVFINAWNEYTISTVLISTASNRPITVGITQFSSFNMIAWQYLFAASLLATIPVVILFMTIEKHLTSGLTSGGVKG